MGEDGPGRRERKKSVTRASIATAAQRLFLERGFDAVSVREVADAADVSPTTVFAHFPQKEALAFSDEDERHERLVHAVVGRAGGVTVSEALKAHYLEELAALDAEPQKSFMAVMTQSPALIDYAERMWLRHEDALVAAITAEHGLTQPTDVIRLYVRFALQIQLVATHDARPQQAIDAGFRLLDLGWADYESGRADGSRVG